MKALILLVAVAVAGCETAYKENIKRIQEAHARGEITYYQQAQLIQQEEANRDARRAATADSLHGLAHSIQGAGQQIQESGRQQQQYWNNFNQNMQLQRINTSIQENTRAINSLTPSTYYMRPYGRY